MDNLWQSPSWKAYQESLGRETRVYNTAEGSALVIIDRTAGNLATWEVPRGPTGSIDAINRLALQIVQDAQKEHALLLRVSPITPLSAAGFSRSTGHTQPEATRILNLQMKDDVLLNQMKPKGRYNIRLAQRHAIDVRESSDVEAFHALMKRTGDRDRFGILPLRHYKTFLETIPGSFLLLAYHPQTSDIEPIAGLIGVIWEGTGIYYYGASNEQHRALMAPYLLQWAAMKHCQAQGCTRYDLLGVAPPDAGDDHPWAGITNFKEKFGGEVVTYPPEQEIVLRPVVWKLLQWKRKILG